MSVRYNLPPRYITFLDQFEDAPNKVFIKGLFNMLNEDGLLNQYVSKLLDKQYSRSLKSAVPVLATDRVKMPNQYRHYTDLLLISGTEYYLSSQWNKPQRATLLHWLNSEVFKPRHNQSQQG